MVREDGEQVHSVISHDIMNAFRAEISVNHPFFEKGYISEQMENALKYYIVHLRKTRRSKQHSALDMHSVRLQQDLHDLKEGIITYMVSEGYWEDYSTTGKTMIKKHLIEAVKYARNITDKRPVNTWIRRLYDAGLIEGIGVNVYKFTNTDAEISTEGQTLVEGKKEEGERPESAALETLDNNNDDGSNEEKPKATELTAEEQAIVDSYHPI